MGAEQEQSSWRPALPVAAFATIAAGALLLGRVSLWAAARPLQQVQRQLIDGVAPPGGWTFDRLIVDAAATALVGVGAVLVVLVVLNAAGALLGSIAPAFDGFAKRVTPSWLRRTTLALCGVALTASVVPTTAQAFDSNRSPAPHGQASPVSGLPLPDLPSSAARTVVTVSSGDSLWSIARGSLPASATDSAVATRVAQLYADNRQVIGDNPNLIFPGQQLIAPGGVA